MTSQELALKPDGQLADVSAGDIMMNAPLLAQIDSMAKRMASAKNTIPAHLKGSEGDCWAVIMQSIQWRMNPFVVAQKTHLVNGTLGYEAQLVNAVVKSSGAITGSFKYDYSGEGVTLSCRVGAILKGDDEITWGQWLSISQVTIKNSPLWKTNPPQQLGYLQVKNWARAHCPEALLGVYTPDELQEIPRGEREVGPATSDLNAAIRSPKDEPADAQAEYEAAHVEPTKAPDTGDQDLDDIIIAMQNTGSLQDLARVVADASAFIGPDTPQEYKDALNAAYKQNRQRLDTPEQEFNF